MNILANPIYIYRCCVITQDFPGGSDGKESACQCRRPGFSPWVGKIPWRREWLPAPVSLPGKFHGQRSLVGYIVHEWVSEVTQSCLTLCDPMDCSLPSSSVHGIFQAIVLEWIAISFSRGSSWPRDRTQVSCIVDRCFTIWATREVRVTLGIWI